jgi:hypothetical protein
VPEELDDLKRKRSEVLEQISRLGDFRPGSISVLVRHCGKSGCRCSQPDDPGHGPNLRLTYKINGRTYSESLPNQAMLRKARREIAEFRKFQKLSCRLVEINSKICQLTSSDISLAETQDATI